MAGVAGCGPVGVCPDDPSITQPTEDCGVWVSAKLGKDTNPGTQGSPVASLTHAVELARGQQQHRVFACGETWTEPLVVPAGVSLYGGFDCTDGWKYKGDVWRAMISTGPDQIPIKTDGIGAHITISDLVVHAGDASIPGGSSIGVLIPDAVEVLLHRCEIIAGNGARGADGDPGGGSVSNGAPGNDGAGACSATVGKGGASAQTACGAVTSMGGKGGDGGDTAADGEPGAPDPDDPKNPFAGAAGKGQTAASGCSAGKDGADGADGAFGHGAVYDDVNGWGHLTKDGYVGVPGQDGQPGAPGQGGGGGGASLGGAGVCGAAAAGGAGGGSGGAGACGGAGGKGGRPGGSSFGIASRTPKLSVIGCKLWVGRGGDGGNGGAGQDGGDGGAPGQGGAGKGSLSSGCAGGSGGRGGKGGPGGGGFGGHAIALATLRGTDPFFDDTAFPEQASPGGGGVGGPPSSSNVAAVGAAGRAPPNNDFIFLEP